MSLHRRFHKSLTGETSSCEKYLEIFSKILGFCHFRDYFASGSPIARLLKEVRDSLVNGSPSREKDLEKFFKILHKGFWRLARESYESHANLFFFSASPSPKTTIFTHKTCIFIFNLHSNFKKRYGFLLIFTLFQV